VSSQTHIAAGAPDAGGWLPAPAWALARAIAGELADIDTAKRESRGPARRSVVPECCTGCPRRSPACSSAGSRSRSAARRTPLPFPTLWPRFAAPLYIACGAPCRAADPHRLLDQNLAAPVKDRESLPEGGQLIALTGGPARCSQRDVARDRQSTGRPGAARSVKSERLRLLQVYKRSSGVALPTAARAPSRRLPLQAARTTGLARRALATVSK